ncbi:Dolichyl-phosphate-mannose-protein mannosyltransferase-domain-containing protein [Polychytrium aggregatum]|uniref:Dolichyl-phosphate-mannose-protein mannosyltransferase-domain-containing protein n=1 Tax=Polychytrium aggregatum TaxID=110093 RepID=UPI0022FDCBFD|nr:Dolichyl-phosphate-mannose-protein mannosyltransferase-domain-containing protein [Polychytrium aggregatum]KAI9209712.1 Dolichyl-phosphate-mannose-protein mannosyltransferase-domain-containing protein [Polychytrium aggregatum]
MSAISTADGLRKRHEIPSKSLDPTIVSDASFDDVSGKSKSAKAVRTAAQDPDALATTLDHTVGVILTVLAFFTRIYNIGWANFVVWDEAHFGKFASFYLKREFYFDVHPPLGKILLGFSGILARYNGSFAFESGGHYPEGMNYTTMRIFAAVFGALMVPAAYYTGIQLRLSKPAAILLGTMVLLDTSYIAITRFILLDSMLLFFTCLSAYCLVTFRNYQKFSPFSAKWYFWLFATGFSLGCVVSVKWVGLFAIALIGLHTVDDLWDMWGDRKLPLTKYAKHWAARIVFLIVVPISIYIFSFWLHFTILNHSGDGDAQMSSLFQAGLEGTDFHLNPIEVVYGSKVTLKNNAHGGGLLHSHVQKFPTGSEQQQVTCYHHKDDNNNWIIDYAWGAPQVDPDTIVPIKDGDIVRLVHDMTKRNLHSHIEKAPVTTTDNEVSCYGNSTVGDANDHWKVEIVDDVAIRGLKQIHSLTTRFRLRHVNTGCLLRSSGVTLPDWGFKQAEVVCAKKNDLKSSANIWNIEKHVNDKLPAGQKGAYKSRFFKDFIDLNVAMWTSNNALTPDPDNEDDNLVSHPYQWPFGLVGLRMCGWGPNDIKFYLLGHPLIWWGSTVSLAVFGGLVAVYLIRYQRKFEDWKTFEDWDNFYFASKVAFFGWFLHYLPFYIMGRVMYLHHYFPAVYFAMIMLALMLDHLGQKLGSTLHRAIILGAGVAIVLAFWHFAPFAFGFNDDASNYASRRWLKSWKVYGDE